MTATTPNKRAPCSMLTRSSRQVLAASSASKMQLTSFFDSEFKSDGDTMPQLTRTAAGKRVARNDVQFSKAITRILALETSQWTEAGQALYNYVEKHRKVVGGLESKLTDAIDAKVKDAERIADILRRGPCVDPDEQDKIFMVFKTRRYARLFVKKPEMLEHMKTKAQTDTYNKGWKAKVNFYEVIAEDAQEILVNAEFMCKVDEERGALIEGMNMTLRETIDAMDWYADNKHAAISAIYEEYKEIPPGEMFKEDDGKLGHLV